MTIKIIPDTIGGTVRQDGTGIRATRVFRVTGIRTAADYHMLIPLTLTGIPYRKQYVDPGTMAGAGAGAGAPTSARGRGSSPAQTAPLHPFVGGR